MTRLIDADKLKFVDALIAPVLVGDSAHWETIILKDRIDKAPIVDAVPVIRCKRCKYFGDYSYNGQSFCTNERTRSHPDLSLIVHEDFYCGYAEEK